MEIEVLIYFLFQSYFVRDDKFLLRYFLISGDVLFSHQIEQLMFRVEFLIEEFLNLLIPFVFQVIQDLDSSSFQIEPKAFFHHFIQFTIDVQLINVEIYYILGSSCENFIPHL